MSIIEREHAVEAPAVTTRDVLHRAADLLEEFDWRKYGLWAGDISDEGCRNAESFCMVGAVLRARLDLGLPSPRWWHYGEGGHYEAAEAYFGDDGLADWNDAPWRTKADVVARLRETAEASA